MWYKDWFRDENYTTVYQHRDAEEAESFVSLIEETAKPQPDDAILDLCCGAGRHAIEFAERGYRNIAGMDLSPTLLSSARERASEAGLSIQFFEADMRHIPSEPPFDLIVNAFTSFGYFQSDEENFSVIEAVAKALSSEGVFVIDFLNEAHVRKNLTPYDVHQINEELWVEQQRWIEAGRVEKRLLLRSTEPSGGPGMSSRGEAKEYVESVRLFTGAELEAMMNRVGIEPFAKFGSYEGSTFDAEESPRVILFGRRR